MKHDLPALLYVAAGILFILALRGLSSPETARQEAKVQLGRIAAGDNPAEERQLDHKAITMKELCALYVADLNAGLILGKGGRPKKSTTIVTDTGRIERHIIPLVGSRRVKDLTKADVNKLRSYYHHDDNDYYARYSGGHRHRRNLRA